MANVIELLSELLPLWFPYFSPVPQGTLFQSCCQKAGSWLTLLCQVFFMTPPVFAGWWLKESKTVKVNPTLLGPRTVALPSGEEFLPHLQSFRWQLTQVSSLKSFSRYYFCFHWGLLLGFRLLGVEARGYPWKRKVTARCISGISILSPFLPGPSLQIAAHAICLDS